MYDIYAYALFLMCYNLVRSSLFEFPIGRPKILKLCQHSTQDKCVFSSMFSLLVNISPYLTIKYG